MKTKTADAGGLVIARLPGEKFTIGPIVVEYRVFLGTGVAGFHTDDPGHRKYRQALRVTQVLGLRDDVTMKVVKFEGERVYVQVKAPKALAILRDDAKAKTPKEGAKI